MSAQQHPHKPSGGRALPPLPPMDRRSSQGSLKASPPSSSLWCDLKCAVCLSGLLVLTFLAMSVALAVSVLYVSSGNNNNNAAHYYINNSNSYNNSYHDLRSKQEDFHSVKVRISIIIWGSTCFWTALFPSPPVAPNVLLPFFKSWS